VKEDHSCCQKDEEKADESKRVKPLHSYVVGAVAAFVACLCCSVPLLLVLLGFSGAMALKESLSLYHWAFDVIGVAILLGACWYLWQVHRKSRKPLRSFVLLVGMTVILYGLMTFTLKQVVMPILLGTSAHAIPHGNHGAGM
jgi:chromate transport protein ChrA